MVKIIKAAPNMFWFT